MLKNIFCLLLGLFLLNCTPYNKPQKLPNIPVASEKEIIENGINGTLRIVVTVLDMDEYIQSGSLVIDTYCGSGGRINKDGTLLTAAHVVKDAVGISGEIYKFDPDTNSRVLIYTIPLEIKEILVNEDLATLSPHKEDVAKLPPIVMIAPSSWSLSLDPKLYVFGFSTGWQEATPVLPPYTIGEHGTLLFRFFPIVQPGDSGGFVEDSKGELVGIVLAMAPTRFSVAVPVTMLDLNKEE